MYGWRPRVLALALALWGLAAGCGGRPPAWPAAAAGYTRYRVYFLDAAMRRLVPVERRSRQPLRLEQAVAAAFQDLCAGPPPGLASAVRPGCRVMRVWRQGDLLHLRMQPSDWDFVPGVPAANAWDDQVEMTAAQFPGVHRLQFWAGGRTRPGGPMPVDGRPGYLPLNGQGRGRTQRPRTAWRNSRERRRFSSRHST